jgi:hypothetical protein
MLSFVGSLEALPLWRSVVEPDERTVVVLATAAAYRGVDGAIDELRAVLDIPFSVVRGTDRSVLTDEASLATLDEASLILCLDGSVLHARSVWRETILGEVLRRHDLVAVGAVGSVFGEVMIDPRGAAPTLGMGFFSGVALAMTTNHEQSMRTRTLLAPTCALAEMGPATVITLDGTWHVPVDGDLEVTRGGQPASL